jgi:hypothetical protein
MDCLFNRHPYVIKTHPSYDFVVDGINVTSIPGFSVEDKGVTVLIDEDKHLKSVFSGNQGGEYQIAGEMLAASCNNQTEKLKLRLNNKNSEEIYAIRVIGTRFTFYRSEVTKAYINQLPDGTHKGGMDIYKYPNTDDWRSWLNYTVP